MRNYTIAVADACKLSGLALDESPGAPCGKSEASFFVIRMNPSPQPESPARPRIWLWIVVPLFAVITVWLVYSFDEPLPDGSDLVITPLSLPDDENAYVLLVHAAQQAAALSPNVDEYLVDEFVTGEAWDDAKVAAWLSPLESVWPSYEAAANTAQAQGPIGPSPDEGLSKVLELGHLSALHARAMLVANRPDDALRIAITSLKAGHVLQVSNATSTQYFIGKIIQDTALKIIQESARHRDVSADQMKRTIAVLEQHRVPITALESVFRSRFNAWDEHMSHLERPLPVRVILAVPGIYKPNKTRRTYWNHLRRLAHLARENKTAQAPYEGLAHELIDELQRRSLENFIGRETLRVFISHFATNFTRSYLEHACRISITQTLLGLRIYEKEHGERPVSLTALSPTILPTTPLDYFDGTAIKYSREVGFIWSAGTKGLVMISRDQKLYGNEIALRIAPEPPSPPAKQATPRDNVFGKPN